VPFGSEGDVRPLLWLGDALAARGHRITLVLTPYYKKFVDARPAWRWLPLGTVEEFASVTRDPRLWEPRRGSELVLELMLESLEPVSSLLKNVGEHFDLVIGTTLATGAFTWAEARRIPRLEVHLQPLCLRSVNNCPLFMEGATWLCRAPKFVKRAVFWLMDKILGRQMLPGVNALRTQLGLQPIHSVNDDIWHCGDRIAGLFPPWYDTPQPDWPKQVRLFGFPFTPAADPAKPLDDVLEKFLAAGPPPILWTHGSANLDTKLFGEAAVGASKILNTRCLLVGPAAPPAGLPELPPGHFLYVPHAPFERLFGRCRAVVHHGGIGTLVQALAAGVPHLVIPRAHDQPDNARRLENLGVGAALSYRKLTPATAAAKLRALLESPNVQASCTRYQKQILTDDPLPSLCAWAEELAANRACFK
jgi:rhamnosyltransferase subunit B